MSAVTVTYNIPYNRLLVNTQFLYSVDFTTAQAKFVLRCYPATHHKTKDNASAPTALPTVVYACIIVRFVVFPHRRRSGGTLSAGRGTRPPEPMTSEASIGESPAETEHAHRLARRREAHEICTHWSVCKGGKATAKAGMPLAKRRKCVPKSEGQRREVRAGKRVRAAAAARHIKNASSVATQTLAKAGTKNTIIWCFPLLALRLHTEEVTRRLQRRSDNKTKPAFKVVCFVL